MQSYNGKLYVCGMDAENNFLGEAALSKGLPTCTVQAACWRHYSRHWWQGLLLGMVAVVLAYIHESLGSGAKSLPSRIYGGGSVVEWTLFWGFVLFVFGGIPAAIGGLLRQPWLLWLSLHARSRTQLVGGALFGFEVNVLLVVWYYCVSILFPALLPEELTSVAGWCQVVSLPWLLSTAWASWQLAADLRTIPREENTPL